MKSAFFVVMIALALNTVAMADEYTAPKGDVACANDDVATTEFPSAESVWWGNRDRAQGPYLKFAKTELPPITHEFPIVLFDLDDSRIRPDQDIECKNIAYYLKKNSSATITVSGHCCDWAGDNYNIELGKRRADSVKKRLVALGVDGDRIGTATYGEKKPSHDNNSAERPLNRRAEAMLTLDRP